jgi:hypothetical protein
MAGIREINAKNDVFAKMLSEQLVGLIERRTAFNRAETRLMRDLLFELKAANDEAEKAALKTAQNHIAGMAKMVKNWEKK